MKVTLVLATLNRQEEVDAFCYSLRAQTYKNFELIVVDQNDDFILNEILDSHKAFYEIRHIRCSEKGLSLARNLGLRQTVGEIVCFPDDDCTYYADTIESVVQIFRKEPKLSMVAGRIVDNKGNDIIRKWKKKSFYVNRYNYYFTVTSITIFAKRLTVCFDERLGAGTNNGSCEDVAFVYEYIKGNKRIKYDPEIRVWHPIQSDTNLNVSKIRRYGIGFGYFIRKNLSFSNCVLFIMVLTFHLLKFLFYLVKLDFGLAQKRLAYISSRLLGFIKND